MLFSKTEWELSSAPNVERGAEELEMLTLGNTSGKRQEMNAAVDGGPTRAREKEGF